MSEADSIFSDASNSDCGSIFSDASESDMETEIFQPKIVTTERTIGNLVAKRKNSFEFQKPFENIRDIRGETDYHSDEYRDRKVMMNLYYDSTEKPDPDQKKFDESASSISSSVSSLSPPVANLMNAKASTPTHVRFGGGKSVLDSVSNTTRRRIHELSMKNSAPKRDAKTVDKENYKPKISKLLSRFEAHEESEEDSRDKFEMTLMEEDRAEQRKRLQNSLQMFESFNKI